jgi:hypothetical protein
VGRCVVQNVCCLRSVRCYVRILHSRLVYYCLDSKMLYAKFVGMFTARLLSKIWPHKVNLYYDGAEKYRCGKLYPDVIFRITNVLPV